MWTPRSGPFYPYRFYVLLGALALVMVAAPLVYPVGLRMPPIVERLAMPVIFATLLVAAALAASRSPRTFISAVILVAPLLVLEGVDVAVTQAWLVLAKQALSIIFLGYVIILMLAYLFSVERVTGNTVAASLCIYLLLGIMFAIIYSVMEYIHPGSFNVAAGEGAREATMSFGASQSVFPLYYSLVTMTTLGYGDVLPVSPAARMVAALQAVAGQIYLAVLVARLVGLHVAHSTHRKVDRPD